MKKYIPGKIEAKWQKKWQEAAIYKVSMEKPQGKKFYLLVEFTYPSGDLHMGHWFAFAVPDILSRMKRMQGFEVFAPNGFDAFGLPAENAAIKKGIHPQDWTYSNIEKMKEQFGTMGASYDWEHQVITCDSDYYRWNQWIFLKMYEKGLAYRDKAMANWCPKDQCVLANENVENGKCWRCGSEVIQKEVGQWFLKITDYAEKLLWPQYKPGLKNSSKPGLEIANWPKSLKEGQNNWIGKSEGAVINFPVADSDYQIKQNTSKVGPDSFTQKNTSEVGYGSSEVNTIEVFTTRPDTLFGATFLVLAPEHPAAAELLSGKWKVESGKLKEIKEYIKRSQKKSELERKESKEKTGVFTGSYAVNPVNSKKIPIWMADYVLMGYGTGAIMSVPAHDQRDFEFARKYKLPIIPVIAIRTSTLHASTSQVSKPTSGVSSLVPSAVDGGSSEVNLLQQHNLGVEPLKEAYTDEGAIINSGDWNGWKVPQDIHKVINWLEAKGRGQRQTSYHLRDWSISRQRYWGTPIPIIYCKNCARGPVNSSSHSTSSPSADGLRALSGTPSAAATPCTAIIDGKEYAIVLVPYDQLPVELPYTVDFAPRGKPPLATAEKWVNVKCPNCGSSARREVETMDTFVDSSWYFLRYLRKVNNYSARGPVNSSSHSTSSPSADGLRALSGTPSAAATPRSNIDALPFDHDLIKNWLPVDIYFGGAEHTLGHTLYSRFFFKFLQDIGAVPKMDEYAKKRVQHGVILGPNGRRMSKSRGNVVNPDEEIKRYGADSIRMYLAFLGPYDLVAPWTPGGIGGVYHFLERVWKLAEWVAGPAASFPPASAQSGQKSNGNGQDHADLRAGGNPPIGVTRNDLSPDDLHWLHKTIKKVTEDIENIKFNTAIAALMEWLNYLSAKAHKSSVSSSVILGTLSEAKSDLAKSKTLSLSNGSKGTPESDAKQDSGQALRLRSGQAGMTNVGLLEYETFLKLLAPFAPHITEELYQRLRAGISTFNFQLSTFKSIHLAPWPEFDPNLARTTAITLVVQVNGKVRAKVPAEAEITKEEAEKLALSLPQVTKYLGDKKPQKTIFVPGKLINLVK